MKIVNIDKKVFIISIKFSIKVSHLIILKGTKKQGFIKEYNFLEKPQEGKEGSN